MENRNICLISYIRLQDFHKIPAKKEHISNHCLEQQITKQGD